VAVRKGKAIRNEADCGQAIARIDALMEATPGTPDCEELDVLADLVEPYEQRNVPIVSPRRVDRDLAVVRKTRDPQRVGRYDMWKWASTDGYL
jgi:antitoxin component HigA of HigAB toxin-antitoxin module